MFSWWKNSDGAIRLTDDDLFFNEKLIFDDKHVLLDEEPLSHPDALRENPEAIDLLDPVVAENLFLTAKKQRSAICPEDQVARSSNETAWRIITRILFSDTSSSLFSLLLHVAAIALACAGKWYLYQVLLNLEEHKDEGRLDTYSDRCGEASCEWHRISWNESLYNDFWERRTVDVLYVVRRPLFYS
jgi:hypothetical protein